MALLKPPSHFRQASHAGASPFDDLNVVEFSYTEIPIGGKLIQLSIRLTDYDVVQATTQDEYKDYIRITMAKKIAEYMITQGFIEFTQKKDPTTFDVLVNARCYLAPSDQVKILRTHYEV